MGCKCGNANCALNASEAVYHCRSRAGVIRAGSHGWQGHRGGGPLPRAPTGQGASSALPGSSPWASGLCTRVGDRDPQRALAGGGPGHPQGCPSHRACAEHAAGAWRCRSLSGPGLVSSPGSWSEAVKRGLLLQLPESDLSAGPSWPPGSRATLSRAPSSCVNPDDNSRLVGRCSGQGPHQRSPRGSPLIESQQPLTFPGDFRARPPCPCR